jgi:hypothetical protein
MTLAANVRPVPGSAIIASSTNFELCTYNTISDTLCILNKTTQCSVFEKRALSGNGSQGIAMGPGCLGSRY